MKEAPKYEIDENFLIPGREIPQQIEVRLDKKGRFEKVMENGEVYRDIGRDFSK